MDIHDVKETRIIKCDTDALNGIQSTVTLNRYLEVGWILVHCYVRDSGDSSSSQFPCFVVGWPMPYPPVIPQNV
jgi:hypothetical protein